MKKVSAGRKVFRPVRVSGCSTAPKQEPKPDDARQYKRFLKTAEEFGANDDSKALEKTLAKMVKMLPPK